MRKRLFYWEVAGFLWTGAAGTALHFLYDWSGGAVWAAVLGAVNESVWEHVKLLVVPVFLFTVVQLCVTGHRYPDLPAVRAVTTVAGSLAIPVLYYTYTGAFGVQYTWADILIFFLADALLFWLDFRLLRRGAMGTGWQQIAGAAVLWGLLFAFVWCTFRPPALPLFQDPVTGMYGMERG
jgi:hypothetical protein